MKLKRLPEDFGVEEQVGLAVGRGAFGLYRLRKQGLGTLEAVEAVGRKWRLPRQSVAFAGLKDKHAATSQFVTIQGGPQRGISQTNLELEYVGQVERPIHASDITGNRFVIVVRELNDSEARAATEGLVTIARDGLPNYFDSQRFGSVGMSGEYIAKPWCLGDYERAIWLAIADANVHDRPEQRRDKELIRQAWGKWGECIERLRSSPLREVVGHLLRHPGDYRRAITIFPQPLRSLWLATFQSHLWNQILASFIRQAVGEDVCSTLAVGPSEMPFFGSLNDEQRRGLHRAVLPLPSARLHWEDDALQPLYDRVLATEGMEIRQVRVKYPRDSFFSKGERRAVFQPGDLSHELADDELYPGQKKLTLRFVLPRGCYATILVKRLFGDDEGMVEEGEAGVG
jgi:tRNA pseudouridine13 synthase